MHQSSILPGRRFVDPNVVVSHFHIRKGDVVADFGAGSGFFVEALAQHVGSEGKIFACEIQRELVEKIGKTGMVVGAAVLSPEDRTEGELVVMSKKGQVIKLPLKDVPTLGRDTQGVRVMKMREGDAIASIVYF